MHDQGTPMEKHSRIISVSGRTYRATPTMCDIFLAHASDIKARGEMELVPLLHDGGVEMILVGELTTITVASLAAVPTETTGEVSGLPSFAA
jgi:hypothetical protein